MIGSAQVFLRAKHQEVEKALTDTVDLLNKRRDIRNKKMLLHSSVAAVNNYETLTAYLRSSNHGTSSFPYWLSTALDEATHTF